MTLSADSFDPMPHPAAAAAGVPDEPALGALGLHAAATSVPPSGGNRRGNVTSRLFPIVLSAPFFRASAERTIANNPEP